MSTMISKFETKIGGFVAYLNNHPNVVAAVAFVSSLLAYFLLVSVSLYVLEVEDDPFSTTSKIVLATTAVVYVAYVRLIVLYIKSSAYRKHIPGVRKYPYTFTLLKSILQISVLMITEVLGNPLEENNIPLVIPLIVLLHIHLLAVFFACRIGEDCDLINGFLGMSFGLLYELVNGGIILIIVLFLVAVLLMWLKNVLFLVPADKIHTLE